jgi:ribosome-binding factor A
MTKFRRERAGAFIQEEITTLLNSAVQDPRVQNVVVTAVDLTQDRRLARIYVTCYAGEEELQQGLQGLEKAKGFLRRELSQLLAWRFTPEIEFRPDRTWQKGARVDAILDTLDIAEPAPDAASHDQTDD